MELPLLLILSLLSFTKSSSVEFPLTPSDPLVAAVRLGTPPRTLRLLVDTTTDTSWFFCDSRSYRSESATWLYRPGPSCENSPECYDWDTLDYTVDYDDGSYASGELISEKLVAESHGGQDIELHGVTIGCTDRKGSSFNLTVDGVLALAKNSHLVGKLGRRFLIGDRVAFGGDAGEPAAMQRVSLARSKSSRFYAEISRLFLGEIELQVPEQVWEFRGEDEVFEDERGGALFSTFSEKSYVPEMAFSAIVAYFEEVFGEAAYVAETEVCVSSVEGGLLLPGLGVEFRGGVRFEPKKEHLYYYKEEELACLNVGSNEGVGRGFTIGSALMRGYLWEYDLVNEQVGFASIDD